MVGPNVGGRDAGEKHHMPTKMAGATGEIKALQDDAVAATVSALTLRRPAACIWGGHAREHSDLLGFLSLARVHGSDTTINPQASQALRMKLSG